MKIGVDVTKLSRFSDKEEMFSNYILTPEEKERYAVLAGREKTEYLASRWAAKEAIFKATQDRLYLKYSVIDNACGFFVKDHSEIELSVCNDGDTVIAIAINNKSFQEKIQ